MFATRRFSPVTPATAGGDTLPTPLIPRSVLFGNPERVGPQLSPDGKLLAYIAPRDGVLNVWVRTVGEEDDRPITDDRTRPLRMYFWAENSRQIIYAQDTGGDENFHLFLADVESGTVTDLTPYPNVQAGVVATDPHHPDEIVVSVNHRNVQVKDAEHIHLQTGERKLVAENPGDIVGWVADHDLRVRAAIAYRPDGGKEVRIRETEESPWRTVITTTFEDQAAPIAFTVDGAGLYVQSSVGANTLGLYLLDIATGDLKPIDSRDDVDMGGLLFHPVTDALQAVSYVRGRREWVALDPDIAPDFEALKAAAEGDFSIVTRDNTDSTWLVAYTRDSGSPAYYTYDRASRTATLLFTAQPKLDAYTLSSTEPIEISAQDGLTLPCYLTLPAGIEPKNLPMILFPHGGPWARDSWGYSPFVQWLANRGYAVLQVNFRGSTGFGKAFLHAGNREWAKKMQTDLYDAMDYVVAQGIADPERVAIMGGSYGGYATLVGVTMAPERFACGVDLVGPSNIATLFDSIPPYWKPVLSEFLLRVGNPETEPDFIKSISPLFYADKIVRPLLIAQGANDPRVKQPESDQIVQAMRDSGKEVLYLLFEDEGHGFARPENNIKFAAAAEGFLAKHLNGRAEPPHSGEEPPVK